MQITSVKIENFLAVKSGELALADRGLVLIQGENQDDPSADSNGAGKSSVVDAICWALYGTTARAVTGDAVVNKTAKKGAEVEVNLEEGDEKYTIIRGRKPNKLELHLERSNGAAINLTLGTEKETQALIEKIVGCSREVFMAAVYAGQEAMPDLPGMTDKQLKLLIEEAAGVNQLASAYEFARSRHAELVEQTSNSLSKLMAIREKIKESNDRIAQLEAQQQMEQDARKLKIAATEKDIRDREDHFSQLQKEIARLPSEADTKASIAELQSTIDGISAERKRLLELQEAHVKAERFSSVAQTSAKHMHAKAVEAANDLKNVDSRVGTPCKECGKPYAEHDLGAAHQHAHEKLEKEKIHLKVAVDAAKDALTKAAEAKKAVEEFQATMTDPSSVLAEMSKLKSVLELHKEFTRRAQACLQDVMVMKVQVNNLKTAPGSYDALINAEKLKVQGFQTSEISVSKEVDYCEKKRDIAKDAVTVFGPAGVRAHILDTVTPFLNERTSEYLGALSDGSITAVWSTLTKTAKGELREKFNIEVNNSKGADSFAGLSGGEKRKVRLACAMALQDLVATRATKPINLFIADEVDHALDESGLERLMTVLEQKARERGTVLVISHNSLSDWIDTVVTVVKSGGQSKIEGAVA